jgi:hypothetical protein
LVLAGQSKAQIFESMKAWVKQGMPPLEPGAMSYMMSKDQYLTDGSPHNWIAHLMSYTPLMDGPVWGADLSKSPVMLNPQFHGESGTNRRIHDSRGLVVGWDGGAFSARLARLPAT